MVLVNLFLVAAMMAMLPSPQASTAFLPLKEGRPCDLVSEEHGFVCRCNETYCDDVPVLDSSEFFLLSSKAGARLQVTQVPPLTQSPAHDRRIRMNATATYQTIFGFGNALTDAAAIGYRKMTAKTQEQLMHQYWGTGSANFTVGRIPIASCDFSTHVYSYDDVANDTTLSHFSIDVDRDDTATGNKLGFIKEVLERQPLNLFASIWAPPAWMTDTGKTTDNPHLKEGLGDVYSNYIVKFFDAYKNEDIDFWGLTAQNEPAGNTGAWQDLKFTAEQQRDFVKTHLGPALKASEHNQVKLMIMDDQRIHLPGWANTILDDPDAAPFVDGIAVHWYAATEDMTPSFLYFGKMSETHDRHPDYFILATEACEGFLPWSQGPRIGDWGRAETYAHDIMGDLANWAVGWTDWNAFLDLSGGPNWAKNIVDAPILLDTEKTDTFYKNPMFYALAHFSAYVPHGSVRIDTQSTSEHLWEASMESLAFLTPEGKIVLVVLNRIFTKTEFSIENPKTGEWLNYEMPAHSMATFLFD